MYDILECDRRPTSFGQATYVRIHRKDMAVMGFRELWDLFDRLYPGKWGVQVFPERKHLLDQANKYHLFVYDRCPDGLNLCEAPPKGSLWIAEQKEVT
jgi:hypothetical protein